jgi:hypothetical protein
VTDRYLEDEARVRVTWRIQSANSYSLIQGYTNPGHQVFMAPKFQVVAPNIYGYGVRNLFHVTLLVPRNFRWRVELWKICEPLEQVLLRPKSEPVRCTLVFFLGATT